MTGDGAWMQEVEARERLRMFGADVRKMAGIRPIHGQGKAHNNVGNGGEASPETGPSRHTFGAVGGGKVSLELGQKQG
jgi:hypothetical protein